MAFEIMGVNLWGYSLSEIIRCTGNHFILSSVVGALAFFLTQIILSRITLFKSKVGVFSTFQFSFLVALCCAVLSHILEDYFLKIY